MTWLATGAAVTAIRDFVEDFLACPSNLASGQNSRMERVHNETRIMALAHAGMLAAFIAAAAPLSAARVHVYSPLAITTAQLAPTEPDTRRPTVCTEQYAPVCGRLNNVVRTYPNQCYARAAGAEVIAQGPCIGAVVPPAPR